ncbi:MOSC domain-containing protein 2, mitochondrial [Myotis davidii]|uniref:MOSC domain-containing protein 2, mitochondrial n=1 Tax=Myotis davidii TaxID=225400 RepID=L5M370_MYODS|nr:MOSC domain-containing protein 2, mitochondrial [Myotis davidii]
MVTARQEPRLVLVSVAYEDDCLVFRAPGAEQLVLPSKLPSSNANCVLVGFQKHPESWRPVELKRFTITALGIFGLDIKGRDCGDEAAQWFTNFLKTEAFRLVQFEKSMKGRASRNIFPSFVQNYQVAYPDCSPVMILSEASLADLNTRLEKKVKMDHFRPNIVVTGCDAFEEDTWDEIRIGSTEMKKVLACPRCIMTTVDPDTGVIDRKEPLETLKSYRLCNPSEKHIYKSSPLFGIYYSVEKIGSLKVGDPVYKMVQ